LGFLKKGLKTVGKAVKGVVKGVVKIQKKVFKGAVNLVKKAWKNKYIRAGLIIAAIATGVGAIAVAGATGAGAGGILAATGLKGASAFGALMKAGFVGFTGAAGATAGLIGSGGSLGLSGSILAGGSAITPVAPTAVSSAALSTAPTVISGLPGATTGATFTASTPISGLTTTASTGAFSTAAPITSSLSSVAPTTFSSTLGAGATTGGGTFIGGLGAAPAGPMSLAPTTASGTFTVAPSAPVTKAVSTASTKSGFVKGLQETLIGGVKQGGKSLIAQGMYNLVMHGDIKGPEFEQDLVGGGGRAGSYTGSYALPDAIRFTQQGLGSDTIGSTYVNMLQNLNYGTGSLDYARHTNMALMRGIQIPQIQYA